MRDECSQGYLDMSHRDAAAAAPTPDVFGFDDVFTPRFVHLTYHQLLQKGLKFSSRDMVIGQYLRYVLSTVTRGSLTCARRLGLTVCVCVCVCFRPESAATPGRSVSAAGQPGVRTHKPLAGVHVQLDIRVLHQLGLGSSGSRW